MTKFASAFGEKYQQASQSIRTKSFELGGHTFKVRIPLSREIDDINARIAAISDEQLNARFVKMTAPFRTEKLLDGVVITDDDIVIDGRSSKELVKSAITVEQRIVEYIRLLVPEQGDMSDITYDDIEDEFPFPIQIELITKITECIQPGYKDARKN